MSLPPEVTRGLQQMLAADRVVGMFDTALVTPASSIREIEGALYRAQRHSGSFCGEELRGVALYVASVAIERDVELVAVDGTGERILGTASALTQCVLADTSRGYDGKRLLLVAGMLAGPFGLIQAAALARSFGAAEIHAAHLGGWTGQIDECDSVFVVPAAKFDSSASRSLESTRPMR